MLFSINMSLNVQIKKKANESASTVLKRFTKEVQGWGGIPVLRTKRYATRKLSVYKTKKATLKKILNNETRLEQIKMGKFSNNK